MKSKFFWVYMAIAFLVLGGLVCALILPPLQDSKEVLQGNYQYLRNGEFATCSFTFDGTFTTSFNADPIKYSVKGNTISFFNPKLVGKVEDGVPVLPDYQMNYAFKRGKLYLYDVVIQENPQMILERIR